MFAGAEAGLAVLPRLHPFEEGADDFTVAIRFLGHRQVRAFLEDDLLSASIPVTRGPISMGSFRRTGRR